MKVKNEERFAILSENYKKKSYWNFENDSHFSVLRIATTMLSFHEKLRRLSKTHPPAPSNVHSGQL